MFPKTKNYFTKLANILLRETENKKVNKIKKIVKHEHGILNNKNKKTFWGIMYKHFERYWTFAFIKKKGF